MIIIGERLNSTRKPVLAALRNRDADFIKKEAAAQEKAGADFIDFNPAAMMDEEVDVLKWALPLLQEAVTVPLSIDTPNLNALAAGLEIHKGRALFNSLTGEEKKINDALPLLKEHKPRMIVLCMDDTGIPDTPRREVDVAKKTIDRLLSAGIASDDLFLDPLVRTIGADQSAGLLFLNSLEMIKKKLPEIKTVAGLSNVSFGLPRRRLLNRTFMAMAVRSGLDAAIIDPLDSEMMDSLQASRGLLNQDPMLMDFISRFRARKR